MAELFGWEIKKREASKAKSFVAPSDEEGTIDIAGGAGFFGQYLTYDKAARNDYDLIRKYRQTSENPECDQAIEDIINEAITADETEISVAVNLDWVPLSMSIKKKMDQEFKEILTLLQWKKRAHDIFRRWYIDGRIFFHKMIDEKSPRKGITEIRYIDPKFIKKIREVNKEKGKGGTEIIRDVREWYVYNEAGVYPALPAVGGTEQAQGLKISPDAIAYVTSGLYNPTTNQVYSLLQKA
ncbi:MAG: portal protein, partial [Chloroflexota bacterium]|nr:portal protein [Chloroflexota bacterium]